MKQISVIWISIMLAFSSALLLMDVSEDIEGKVAVNNRVGYETHAPIRIDSNAEFDEAHGVVNWATGDGSPGNPWIIEGWDINGTGYGYCIYVGNTTDYFEVRDCVLHDALGPINPPFYSNINIQFYKVSNGNIFNNTNSNSDFGILLDSSDDNVIFLNNVSLNIYGVYLYYSNANTISDNSIFLNSQDGIFFERSDNNIISNNTIEDNDWDGIFLYDWCNGNKIQNNTIHSNTDWGIYFNSWCSGNPIWDNVISENNIGIWIHTSSNAEVYNNQLISNSQSGLLLFISSNGIVKNNTATGNNVGLHFHTSHTNTISNNTVLNNQKGIRIESSNNNNVYHNDIISNTIQGYDDGANNWDCGYPNGGNYWSDYRGVDLNSTSSQDVPPPDGIGDTPYVIDGDSQDNYPLMKSIEFEFMSYNISLLEGWNLVSLPTIQSNESLGNVLESIDGKWDSIQAYDSKNGIWLSNIPSRPDSLNDLDTLNHKMGFWINIAEPNVSLTVRGHILTSTNINLYAGWNLVGYPTKTEMTVANALWGTGADKVEVFDPAEPYRIREVGSSYVMKPGEGYWIHVPADTIWIIDW